MKKRIFEDLPAGWRIIHGTLTQPVGTVWICNSKSILSKDYESGLLIVNKSLYEMESRREKDD